MAAHQVPLVRYADVPVKESPVYTHPANVAARRANGDASSESEADPDGFTVLDREECVVGRFCARKVETSDGKLEVNVGKVVAVRDDGDGKFKVQLMRAGQNQYESKCVRCGWYNARPTAFDMWDHETVVAYFDNLAGKKNGTASRGGTLPVRIQSLVLQAMGWHAE